MVISEGGDICPIFLNSSFCLNPLYISRDSKIHLSESSVGGTFHGRKILDKETVAEYNEYASKYLRTGPIKQVIVFFE